jgi:hypothetical protein
MNKAMPLQVANFDSTHLAANVSATLQFLDFLKTYREEGKRTMAAFEDSMFVIAAEFPPVKVRDRFIDFANAFKADQQAFDNHLAGITKLYSNVLNVLLFMQHSKYTLKGKTFTFKDSSDIGRYRNFMNSVDATQKELAETIAASRKATANVNESLKAFNDATASDVEGNAPKKKKKK